MNPVFEPTVSNRVRVLAWPAHSSKNPYARLVASHTSDVGVDTEEFSLRRLLTRRWDLIHIHWPDLVLLQRGRVRPVVIGMSLLLLLRLHKRLFGCRIVWTVHNLEPHEIRFPRFGPWYLDQFVALVDGLLSPSHYGLGLAQRRFERLADLPAAVAPIGAYAEEYGSAPERSEARAALGWPDDATILLSFGLVRKYKNLPHLIRIFSSISDPSLRLVVAGSLHDPDELEHLQVAAMDDPRVRLDLQTIPDDVVATYFAACDLVVLPFDKILNSSSAVLALTYHRRVVAPSLGAIPELAQLVGGDWVMTYDGELSASTINRAILTSASTESPSMGALQWPEIDRVTSDLFRQVIAEGRRPTSRL